jgi:hypothetical protein
MANFVKHLPAIIRKLDAAWEALKELADCSDERDKLPKDTRIKLQHDQCEYAYWSK